MKSYDVVAIGELNADLVMTGLSSMPVPGREIIARGMSLVLGSSTAICAAGMARLGLKTGFTGKIGRDAYGEVVRRSLGEYGVDLSRLLEDASLPTGLTVSLSTPGDRALVTCLGSIDRLCAEDVDLGLLNETRHIHVGSFFLQSGLRPGLAGLFREAHKRGVTTSLDAGWDDTGKWDYGIREVLRHTDFFFPNESEALAITEKASVPEAAEELATLCKTVAVKMGPKGARLVSGCTVIEQAPYDTKPVDTTGAGDSFNAGFLYGFLTGRAPSLCLSLGNACGSIAVTRIGGAAACPSLEEAESLMNGTFLTDLNK